MLQNCVNLCNLWQKNEWLNRYKKVFVALLWFPAILYAQNERQPIQFSGLVVTGDSLYGIPYANIYIPFTVRGTSSNLYGFFSLVTLGGDSVIISCIGYRTRKIQIPIIEKDQSFTMFVELKPDTTQLEEVVILPLPPRDRFKDDFLALTLPGQKVTNFEKNFNQKVLRKLFQEYEMDGSENYQAYSQTYINSMIQKNQVTMNPLLNPFAWYSFIQALRKGKFMRYREEDTRGGEEFED